MNILLLFLVIKAWSQQLDFNSGGALGGSQRDLLVEVETIGTNEFIMVGGTSSFDNGMVNKGQGDLWLVKIDSWGDTIWSRTYGGDSHDHGVCCIETQDGDIMVLGHSESNNFDLTNNYGSTDIWLMRLDQNGNIIWSNTYGGTGREDAYAVTLSPDGGFLIAGSTQSTDGDISNSNGGLDAWVLKVDSLGTLIWEKTFGGSSDDRFEDVILSSSGSYILTGWSNSLDNGSLVNKGAIDSWVINLDFSGTVIWSELIGGSLDDFGTSVEEVDSNVFVISGYSYSQELGSQSHGDSDILIFSLDGDGNIRWSELFGGEGDDMAWDITRKSNCNSAFICGHSSSKQSELYENKGSYDAILVEVAVNGELIESIGFGGDRDEILYGVKTNSKGKLMTVGTCSEGSSYIEGYTGGNDGILLSYDYLNTCWPIIPNVFTPNGDGENDVFSIEELSIDHLEIFNRWGSSIVTLDQSNTSWNGTLQGKECSESVYYYIGSYKDWRFSGTINLIR